MTRLRRAALAAVLLSCAMGCGETERDRGAWPATGGSFTGLPSSDAAAECCEPIEGSDAGTPSCPCGEDATDQPCTRRGQVCEYPGGLGVCEQVTSCGCTATAGGALRWSCARTLL